MTRLRNYIRFIHREFDGFIGTLFSNQKPLKLINYQKFPEFQCSLGSSITYSRIDHFSGFHLLPIHKNQNPSTCDLKVYQDLFVYSFIMEKIQKGAKILEIGGGESRIIKSLKEDFEFWNLDKLEGQGHGPTKIYSPDSFYLVRDNIGNFSTELPEDYFDLVFSISVVEHFPEDEESIANIILDMKRVMKKNAFNLHCVDSILYKDHIWFHPMIQKLANLSNNIDLQTIAHAIPKDNQLWVLPKYAYYTRWFPITKSTNKDFGKPFSINILLRNS